VSIFVKPGSASQSPQQAQRDADTRTAETARVFGELVKPGAPPARNAVEKDAAQGARSSGAARRRGRRSSSNRSAASGTPCFWPHDPDASPSPRCALRRRLELSPRVRPCPAAALARALVELRAQPESPDVQQATAIVSRTLQLMDFVESRRLSEIRAPNRFGEGKPR
jgi:hypothetical protein